MSLRTGHHFGDKPASGWAAALLKPGTLDICLVRGSSSPTHLPGPSHEGVREQASGIILGASSGGGRHPFFLVFTQEGS